jgi:hypothetical protein
MKAGSEVATRSVSPPVLTAASERAAGGAGGADESRKIDSRGLKDRIPSRPWCPSPRQKTAFVFPPPTRDSLLVAQTFNPFSIGSGPWRFR